MRTSASTDPRSLHLIVAVKLGAIYGIAAVVLVSALAVFRAAEITLPTIIEWALALLPTTILGIIALYFLSTPFSERDSPMSKPIYVVVSALRLMVFSFIFGLVATTGLSVTAKYLKPYYHTVKLDYLYWDPASLFWAMSAFSAVFFSLGALLGWYDLAKISVASKRQRLARSYKRLARTLPPMSLKNSARALAQQERG